MLCHLRVLPSAFSSLLMCEELCFCLQLERSLARDSATSWRA